jgi:3-oxoacyl-[acyl-carrier protein] reductase
MKTGVRKLFRTITAGKRSKSLSLPVRDIPVLDITFENKVVLITGASRGIGRQLALAFSKQGAVVVANYHNSKKEALSLEKTVKDNGGQIILEYADISKRKDVKKMSESISRRYGRIDILVNNAGVVTEPADWMSLREDGWKRTIGVNLKGVYECSRCVGKTMLNQKYGKMINISSVVSISGADYAVAYAAAKAGVDNLTKSFAKALSPYVNVNSIAFGRLNLGINSKRDASIHCMMKDNLMQRPGQAEDAINTVFFLASDASGFITGQTLVVDGGGSLR